jgi:hypothetical protein
MAPDTAAAVAWRVADREAGERAYREALDRFGPVTAANAADVLAWMERRRAALRA